MRVLIKDGSGNVVGRCAGPGPGGCTARRTDGRSGCAGAQLLLGYGDAIWSFLAPQRQTSCPLGWLVPSADPTGARAHRQGLLEQAGCERGARPLAGAQPQVE